ncbi:hypothetical protein MASR2M39_31720 [Ignavibacteriales bacterium]
MKEIKDQWNKIVEITTDESGVLAGLRNTIFLDMNSSKENLIDKIKVVLKLLVLILKPGKKVVLPHNLNIAFYFSSGTSAMFGNLYPVLEKYGSDEVFIIRNKKVHSIDSKYSNFATVENIIFSCSFLSRWRLIETLKYYNILVKNSVNNSLSTTIQKQRIKYCYLILLILNTKSGFKKIIENSNIKVLISTSDYFPFDFAIFNSARNCNINTILIQHGIIGTSYYPFTAEYFLVWGEYFKEQMLKIDPLLKDRIFAFGSPLMHSFLTLNNYDFNRRRVEVDNKLRFLILSDTQGSVVFREIYEKYDKFLTTLDFELFEWKVKLHPAENIQYYERLNLNDKLQILPKEKSLSDALSEADIVLTIWSTAAFEAMLMMKPVIVLDIHDSVYEYAWWPKVGGGMYLSSLHYGVNTLMNRDLTNTIVASQNNFISKNVLMQSNPANEISKFINRVIHEKI